MIRGSLRGPKREIHSSVQSVINEMTDDQLGGAQPPAAPAMPPAAAPAPTDPNAPGGVEHESEESKLLSSAMKGLKNAAHAIKKLKSLGDTSKDALGDAGGAPKGDDLSDLDDNGGMPA